MKPEAFAMARVTKKELNVLSFILENALDLHVFWNATQQLSLAKHKRYTNIYSRYDIIYW